MNTVPVVGDRVTFVARVGEAFRKADVDGVVGSVAESFNLERMEWDVTLFVRAHRGASVLVKLHEIDGLRVVEPAAVRTVGGAETVVTMTPFRDGGWYATADGRHARVERDWNADGQPKVLEVRAEAPLFR